MRSLATTLLLCLACIAAGEEAATVDYDRDEALATSQAAIGRIVRPQALRDSGGESFDLAGLRGKPLVVSMIYTSCHHICPVLTRNLARTVDVANEALGPDSFSVVTIGFDWAVDKPDRMRVYAAERGIDVPNWHFLSGDADSIMALSKDLGFVFFPSPKGFDHLTQTTIIDGDGRVYRQVYGIDVEPPSLVEPLKELVFDTPKKAGLLEHWTNKFRLFCTVYDASSGRYRFDYSIATTILVGLLCLGAIATFIVREWRQQR